MNGGHGFDDRYQFASAMGTETITSCYAQVAADRDDLERRPINATGICALETTFRESTPFYHAIRLSWKATTYEAVIGIRVSRS